MHVTTDDLFISMDMAVRKEDRVALKKEKKLCLSHQAIKEKALVIVAQEKSINSLNVADLDNGNFGRWRATSCILEMDR